MSPVAAASADLKVKISHLQRPPKLDESSEQDSPTFPLQYYSTHSQKESTNTQRKKD